jgi:hypothetical protein
LDEAVRRPNKGSLGIDVEIGERRGKAEREQEQDEARGVSKEIIEAWREGGGKPGGILGASLRRQKR